VPQAELARRLLSSWDASRAPVFSSKIQPCAEKGSARDASARSAESAPVQRGRRDSPSAACLLAMTGRREGTRLTYPRRRWRAAT